MDVTFQRFGELALLVAHTQNAKIWMYGVIPNGLHYANGVVVKTAEINTLAESAKAAGLVAQ